MAAKRSAALELAVLGVLSESPQHGYELRKRLVSVLGLFATISYGALYPTLKSLVTRGYIAEQDATPTAVYPKRNRIVYALTPAGTEYFESLVADDGAGSWDDEIFAVRIALFGQTSPDARLHILQGRRRRLEDRLDQMRSNLAKGRERLDAYTLELQQHGLDAMEREVAWLGDLISREEAGGIANTKTSDDRSSIQNTSRPRLSADKN